MNTSDSVVEKRFGFWARLPLGRKMLAAFGGLFVMALLIAVVTLFGLNQTNAAYEDSLNQGVAIRAATDQLTINLLLARREAKDYLLRWKEQGADTAYSTYATPFLQDTAAMREEIQRLLIFAPEAPTASQGALTEVDYQTEIETLTRQAGAYQQSFVAYTEVTRARGSDENTGLEGEMRTAAHNLEAKIGGQPGLEALEITLLQLRRSEKDYINRGAQSYIDQVHTLLPQLKTQISQSDQLDAATQADLLAQADSYLKKFDEIVAADQQLLTHDAELTDAALALQASIAKIETLGETLAADDINRARANSTQTLAFSLGVVTLALLISVVLALSLSRQLTNPILSLTSTAQQISEGNFETQAEVASADEVGTLAQTFNSMTSRLRQAFEDVRKRAAELATVAEVGTATATILQTDRLLQEVVDLTKERFNLYHSHIYLLDKSGENLVLAMGAGEPGRQMKAKGLSIPLNREQSLVARAARERKGVTVNDVTQAPDFLPNPLLPDTRSELATPMIVGGKVIGVFDVQSDQVGRFTDSDINIQATLAAQVATSIQNVRSFEQSKAQADLESMVNAIGQKIQRATSVDDTLQTAIREIGLALGASRVSAGIGVQSVKQGNDNE